MSNTTHPGAPGPAGATRPEEDSVVLVLTRTIAILNGLLETERRKNQQLERQLATPVPSAPTPTPPTMTPTPTPKPGRPPPPREATPTVPTAQAEDVEFFDRTLGYAETRIITPTPVLSPTPVALPLDRLRERTASAAGRIGA